LVVASPLDLIATGAIASVTPGSPADDVRASLGGPPVTSVSREPVIWKYNGLEVTLSNERVELLHVELDQPLPGFLEDGGVSVETTREELDRMLASRDVRLEPFGPLTFQGGQVAFRSRPGFAVAVFDDSGLRSISSSLD
jgi:hypothetical protein